MNKGRLLACSLVTTALIAYSYPNEAMNIFGAITMALVLHALPIATSYFMSKQAAQYNARHTIQNIG